METLNCVLSFIIMGLAIYNWYLESRISHQLTELQQEIDQELNERLDLLNKQDKQIMGYMADIAQYLSDYEKNVANYADHTQQTLNYDRLTNRHNLKIIVDKIHELEQEK